MGVVGAVGDRGGGCLTHTGDKRYNDKEGKTRNALIHNNLQYI